MLVPLCVLSLMIRANAFSSAVHRGFRSMSSLSLRMQEYTQSDKVITAAAFKAISHLDYAGDLLVVPFYKSTEKDDSANAAILKGAIPSGLSESIKNILREVIDEHTFKADVAAKQLVRLTSGSGVKYVALLGLGPNPKKDGSPDLEVASALRIGKALGFYCKDTNAVSAGIVLPAGTNNAGVAQLILGFQDSLYTDNRYKKVPDEGFKPLKINSVTLLGASDKVAADISVNHGLTSAISEGVSFARDLVNAPANSKTPLVIAGLARGMAVQHNMKCVVLEYVECSGLGMGAYLGVQQGDFYICITICI